MPVTVVLLDMGGVLLDLAGSQGLPYGQLDFRGRQALLRKLRGRRRLSPERLDSLLFQPWRSEYGERYRRGREASWSPHLERLRKATDSDDTDLELLGAWTGPLVDQCRAVPGAREAVAELVARGLSLGLVSNVPLPGVLYRRMLQRHDLEAGLRTFQFSYDSGHRKPSPYMLRRALEDLEAEPAAAVMVGDRRNSDVAAGRAAGLTTIWIESEFTDGPRPDVTIPSITELPAAIDRLS